MTARKELITECKQKLIETKADLLNRLVEIRRGLLQSSEEKGGDEADQTLRILNEKQSLTNHQRILENLIEIETALRKIDAGQFGVCEETEELIEEERLRTLPWTRLSIEGAEMLESRKIHYK